MDQCFNHLKRPVGFSPCRSYPASKTYRKILLVWIVRVEPPISEVGNRSDAE